MELFLCTLYTVRGSNKQGNVIRVNKMNCCIYCTRVFKCKRDKFKDFIQ